RGAWSLSGGGSLGSALGKERVLAVNGSASDDDVIKITVDPDNSALVDVFDGPIRTDQFQRALFDRIDVFGFGGNDHLFVDTTNGVPAPKVTSPVVASKVSFTAGGITFNGGPGSDSIDVIGPVELRKSAPPDAAGGGVADFARGRATGEVSF